MPPKKVLIVEDEAALLKVLAEKFSLEGYSVFEARNGEEGLAAALLEHPDIILLDIVMPKMDGITMLKKLREDVWGHDAEVIVLTNLSDNTKLAEAMELGSYNFLIKTDWKIGDIIAKVKERLHQ